MLPHTRKHATEQRAAATIVDGMNLLITAAGSTSACVLFRSASQWPVTQFRDGAWYQGVPSEKCTKHLVPCHLVLRNRVQTGHGYTFAKTMLSNIRTHVTKHSSTHVARHPKASETSLAKRQGLLFLVQGLQVMQTHIVI